MTIDTLSRGARSLPRRVRQVVVLVLGVALLLAGCVLLVLPGPGLLLIGLGIAVLAVEFSWARRVAERVTRVARGFRRRLRQLP